MIIGRQKTLLKRYGFDSGDPLIDWLNAALHEIESYDDWVFLERRTPITVGVGENTIVFPSNFFKVQSIRDSTGKDKLIEYERTRFDREIFDPTSTGSPWAYVMTGLSTVQLYPVPDASVDFQVTYSIQLDDMADDDNATSPLPSRFHFPQVVCAAYIGLMAENEEERAGAAQKQYEASLARISSRYDDRTDDEPQAVVDTQGYSNWGL